MARHFRLSYICLLIGVMPHLLMVSFSIVHLVDKCLVMKEIWKLRQMADCMDFDVAQCIVFILDNLSSTRAHFSPTSFINVYLFSNFFESFEWGVPTKTCQKIGEFFHFTQQHSKLRKKTWSRHCKNSISLVL